MNTNTNTPACTCPSGDGSLAWPCPAHGAAAPQDERAQALTFFAYSPDGGFDTYPDAASARKAALDDIDQYRDAADDEWPCQVEEVCWGKILENSTGIENGGWDHDGNATVDYELRASSAALPAQAVAPSVEPEWIDDPHDIEQGMMRNPKWKAAPVQDVAPISGGCGCSEFEQQHCRGGTSPYAEHPECLKAVPQVVAKDVAPSDARKGWRLVPTEPSKDQLAKAQKHWAYSQSWETATDCYRALVAAAPAAPQAVQNPIPQRLRDAFSRIEDSSPAASGMQVFTQMRTAAQAYFQSLNAAQPAAQPADAITGHDLRTSEGGRGYVAEYFAKRLRRHDFSRYIAEHLAADFACALARHLDGQPQRPATASNDRTQEGAAS